MKFKFVHNNINVLDLEKSIGFYEDSHNAISNFLRKHCKENWVIFCIGTDRYIGDCLGPLVGTFLTKLDISPPIFGTLSQPVHAINLRKNIMLAKSIYPNHKIIALDACLGSSDNIGSIQIKTTPIFPGKGVGKKLPPIGDISIIGIVDSTKEGQFLSMHSIRLHLIMQIAEVITKGIYDAFK